MKPLVITPVTLMTTCDIYMCPSMAKHSIASPDAPPGMCFRVCDDHLESLKGLLRGAPVAVKADVLEKDVLSDSEVSVKTAVVEKAATTEDVVEKAATLDEENVFASASKRGRRGSRSKTESEK